MEKHKPYFDELGISEPVMKRIAQIHDFYASILSEPITDVFVSEYVDQENKKVFESLWMFSKSFAMEAQNFLTTDSFDLIRSAGRVVRWEVKKKNYDFRSAQIDSRCNLQILFENSITGVLKASGTNCNKLGSIFRQYVVPSLKN